MDKNNLINLIDDLCLNFETLGEFKIFLQILKNNIADAHSPISYNDFIRTCNTDKKLIRRSLESLIKKEYIVKQPAGRSHIYPITERFWQKIKK